MALSFIWQAAVLHHQRYGWLVPGYVLMGVGIGMVMSPASTDCLNVIAPAIRTQASGVTQTLRQVGGTFGIAILGAIVAADQMYSSEHVSTTAVHRAATTAVSNAYWIGAAVMVLAAIAAGLVLRRQAPPGISLEER